MRMAILAGIFGSLLSIGPLSAQVTVQSSSPTLDSQGRRSISWGTLNRTEAIAVGSLPLTLFYVGFGFDLYAYFSNGLDALYAPWPFKSDRAPALTDKEKTLRLSVAALASLGVAVLDLVLLPRAFAKRHAEGDEAPFPPPSSTNSASVDLSSQLPMESLETSPASVSASSTPSTVGSPKPRVSPRGWKGELDSSASGQ